VEETAMNLRKQYRSNKSHERRHTVAERDYWIDQWRLLAEQALNELDAQLAENARLRQAIDEHRAWLEAWRFETALADLDRRLGKDGTR
jgi:hypothetical protein